MDKKERAELKRLFEAPPPAGKRKFFRKLGIPPMKTGHVLWVQFSHISKWSWFVAAALLLIIIYMNYFGSGKMAGAAFEGKEWFGTALAFMPFLAVACVSESVRSVMYGMEELEMSARFSLKSIILVRMGIVGLENMLLALAVATFVGRDFFQNVVYLLVPYLLTAYGSFLLVRRRRDGGETYLCAGLALAVSALMYESTWELQWIYQERYIAVWLLALVVLAWMSFCESRRTLIQAESIAH